MRGVIETIKHTFAALQLLSVLLFALFLPQLWVRYTEHTSPSILETKHHSNASQEKALEIYNFLALLQEIKPFDVGAGSKALQCILLPDALHFPKQKWTQLSSILKTLGVDSKPYRYYNATKKQHCSGLRLHIRDSNHFFSLKTTTTMLTFFKKNGVILQFSPLFDRRAGSQEIRSLLQESYKYVHGASKMRAV